MSNNRNEDYYPRKCSRWTSCSVNCCPLDPLNERRYTASSDPERTCKEDPTLRVEIAEEAETEGTVIPGGGLTKAERESGSTLDQLSTVWSLKQMGKIEKLKKARNSRQSASTPSPKVVQGYPNHNDSIGAQ